MDQSILQCLPSPLYALVCSFLTLEHKCRCLPMLNRALSKAFVPSLCCKGEASLNLRVGGVPVRKNNLSKEFGQLQYFKYATRVNVFLQQVDQIINFDQTIISRAITTALDNPFLVSLNIEDHWRKQSYGVIPALQRILDHSPPELRNLRSLSISYQESRSLYSMLRATPAVTIDSRRPDWSGLLRCVALQECNIKIEEQNVGNLIDCLPSSLTSLHFEHWVWSATGTIESLFITKLKDPFFIPHLRRLK